MAIRYWLLTLLLMVTMGSITAGTGSLAGDDVSEGMTLSELFAEPVKKETVRTTTEKTQSRTKRAVEGGKDIARDAAESVKTGLAKAKTWLSGVWDSWMSPKQTTTKTTTRQF